MTNYTKTTDFAAKDALPSGNAAKIVKGSEIDAEFDNIATSSATKANANAAALTGTTTFETISDGTIAITAFVDEDNMASDSATLLPTQQSVKAYVDSQVTAQDLDFQADTGGALSIDLDSETLTLTGGTGIDTSGALNAVTFAIDATVATLAGTQTLSNKTLSAPVVSGNLTTDGLVDGRDVAADGTKLDGIEALADVTDTANVTAAGALMDSELTDIAAVKALNQGVATTDSPTFAGLTTSADVSFGDNDKAIFGAGSDLQIYHDGSNSYVSDQGTGSLRILAEDFRVRNAANNAPVITGLDGAGVFLYHNGSEKLTTTATGIDVTGTVTADGLTVDGSGTLQSSTGGILTLKSTNTATDTNSVLGAINFFNSDASGSSPNNAVVINSTGQSGGGNGDLNFYVTNSGVEGSDPLLSMRIDDKGDISFYNSSGTSQSLFWDSSAESLGIGTSSPSDLLDISANGTSVMRLSDSSSPATYAQITQASGVLTFAADAGSAQTGSNIQFEVDGSEAMRIDSGGNVGIGKTPLGNNLSPALEMVSGGTMFGYGDAMYLTGNLYYSGGWKAIATGAGSSMILDGSGPKFYTNASASAGGAVTPTERMRIDSSGNLLVGTTDNNPVNNSANTSADNGVALGGLGVAVARYNNTPMFANRTGTDGTIFDFRKSGTTVGSIGTLSGFPYMHGGTGFLLSSTALRPADSDGTNSDADTDLGSSSSRFKDLYLSGVAYIENQIVAAGTYTQTTGVAANINIRSDGLMRRSTSSIRYKNTVLDATHGLTELLALRPVTYKGNDDGDTVFGGLIAEEVHDAGLTEFVQYNENDEPDALAYGNMVSLCIKAIQEQQATIESQAAAITDLTTRLTTLENN